MKWLTAPDGSEVFEIFRELGEEEFARTPAHLMGARVDQLTQEAKSRGAGDEEKGLAAGFLSALAHESSAKLRAMGATIHSGHGISSDAAQLGIDLGGGKSLMVGKVSQHTRKS